MATQTIVDFAQDLLGVKLYPGQAQALTGYYSSGRPNWLLLAGRRGGKSLLSDVIAIYEAVVPDFSDYLRANEQRYIIIVSTRLDNASLHISNIRRLLKHNKGLARMIVGGAKDRLELSNGVTILSLPASARAGRGFTASTLILDELAHFVDSAGNQSADAVYDALSPTLATFGDVARLVITTTPMSRQGIVYDLYDRVTKGELDDFYLTKAGTRELNPKVSEKTIARARLRDAESAAVEYDAEFRDPIEAYLDSEALDAATQDYRPAEKAEPGQTYYMAIDPATMGDRYAFVVGHREGDLVILDYAHILRPPVNPNAAEDLLVDLVRRFKPLKIRCDTASTVERLKGSIPAMEYTPFTRPMKLRIYGALKETLNLGNLALYRHQDLLDELKALQIRNGVDIAAPKAGRITHDDLADCLALVVDAMVQNTGTVEVMVDPFANWPPNPGERYYSNFGWSDQVNERPHPEGVTWRTCKHRNKGCLACVAELDAEGVYAGDKLVEVARAQENEAWRQDAEAIRRQGQAADERRYRSASKFWQAVDYRLKHNKESRDEQQV